MSAQVGKAAPVAAAWTTIMTAAQDSTVNIRLVNRDQINAITISLAISTVAGAPPNTDYIEPPNLVLPAGGILEEIGMSVAQNEIIQVITSAATLTCRAYGR